MWQVWWEVLWQERPPRPLYRELLQLSEWLIQSPPLALRFENFNLHVLVWFWLIWKLSGKCAAPHWGCSFGWVPLEAILSKKVNCTYGITDRKLVFSFWCLHWNAKTSQTTYGDGLPFCDIWKILGIGDKLVFDLACWLWHSREVRWQCAQGWWRGWGRQWRRGGRARWRRGWTGRGWWRWSSPSPAGVTASPVGRGGASCQAQSQLAT